MDNAMTSKQALIYRVGLGNAIGWLIGLIAFVAMPYLLTDISLLFRCGVFVWYPTVGVVVGVFGVFKHHPILNFPMPWWLRGALVGGWMNFVLILFNYDSISIIVAALMGEYSAYASPFLMVVEGALFGAMIDYFVTRSFGDGWCDPAQ